MGNKIKYLRKAGVYSIKGLILIIPGTIPLMAAYEAVMYGKRRKDKNKIAREKES